MGHTGINTTQRLTTRRTFRPTGITLVSLAFAAYALLYIYRGSFVVAGTRYFTLVDDQMISMRYAENLAHGFGLVWNPGGDRVEGFTNFAWVIYMAVFHLLEIPRPLISLPIMISGAIFTLVSLRLVVSIMEIVTPGNRRSALVAVAFTAFYLPFMNWTLQGTEVSALAMWLLVIWHRALRAREGGDWKLYFLIGALTLMRPDMLVTGAALVGAVAFSQPLSATRHLWRGLGTLAAFFAVETAARWLYFGDVLPNTYYLKMTGFPSHLRIGRGLYFAFVLCWQLSPLIWFLDRHRKRWRGLRSVSALLMVFGAQLAYSAYVGGDAWEWWGGANRFVAIAMPLLFIAVAACVSETLRSQDSARWRFAVGLAAAVIAINVLAYINDPLAAIPRILLLSKPYQLDEDEVHVREALALKERTDSEAVVAVTWAGAIPYFSERPSIDLLGKMDRRIAHEEAHRRPGLPWYLEFYPGHLKWDYAYSIRQLAPDVIQAPLWEWSVRDSWEAPPGYHLDPKGGPWFFADQ